MSCTMLIRLPTRAFRREDFPTLGRPTIAMTGISRAICPVIIGGKAPHLNASVGNADGARADGVPRREELPAVVTRIDHNGKVFTDQVRKQKVATIIQTQTHRIRGVLFHDSDGRLKDDLNSSENFVAVTDAEFLAPDGNVLERAEFLALSKRHIVWVMPANTTEGA
jgi:hypothetical protein